ncbi:MAG TPA: phospholipase D-like domain-containing protein [Burkholderiales bacterium]|nr:phospholipase D-like domain-containing protein [Burkholderiales bacterium]
MWKWALLAAASLFAAGCAGTPGAERPPPRAPSQIVGASGPLPPAAHARVITALAGEGVPAHLRDAPIGAPVVVGNDARLLVDGPATHRAMFEAIARARDHVHLQSYIVEADEIGERLARLLVRKRSQGVRVRVLYDSVGSMGTPKEYFERLKAADIAVCEFNPVNPAKAPRGWRINNRDHRKVLVVDGRVAFTGGINISGVYSAGSFGSRREAPPRESGWRDTHIMTRGPIVGEFQRLFLDAWQRQQCGPVVQQAAYFPSLAPAGDWAMRLVGNDPERGPSEMYLALLSALGRARERAWLTYGYFVPDPETVRTLKDAAARGVDVRLVLPGVSDFWAPLYAGRSHYDDLLTAGVRIFERRDALVHAKTAVIDGAWSSVGSTNLDWRSFVHNYEADVIVLGAEFARGLEELFARDVAHSTEIALDEWRRRGPVSRLREWFARAWEYFL